ncbi:hypothetical protein EZI54_23230 [Marinobacter halodurans]|uniref:Uncharacterized protein n=1 Tax=Marinobacter halodurans TaxID=2528979 RepID=A0ABY1ZDD1_9GAMM|nr:hypothetical protein [Marinobacter halodurans]TBW46402.1 hypothetical protein EZI54_23230 [Marinobacter halodurans]
MTDKNDVQTKREWYQTGWLWVWLIVFWPVGLYGLWKRVDPKNRKWVAIGGAAFVVIGLIGVEDGSSLSSSKGSYSGTGSYLQKDSVVCFTERAFEKQSTLIASGGKNLISGCKVTKYRMKVAIDDMSLFSGKVRVITMGGQTLWTFAEMVDS